MMSESLYIYGASGLGREIAQLVEDINADKPTWDCRFLDDDRSKWGRWIGGYEVVGDASVITQHREPANVVVAIGDPMAKRDLVKRLSVGWVEFPTLIHPNVYMSKRSQIGHGSIIQAGCTLSVENRVGNHVFANFNVVIGHDVTIGDYCSIMTGTVLSGGVVLEEAVYVGTSVTTIQNIRLGAGCIVGAGATVIRDVDPGITVGGVPARSLHRNS